MRFPTSRRREKSTDRDAELAGLDCHSMGRKAFECICIISCGIITPEDGTCSNADNM